MTLNKDKPVKFIQGTHKKFMKFICEECNHRKDVNVDNVDINVTRGIPASQWRCTKSGNRLCLKIRVCPEGITLEKILDRGYAALLGYAIVEEVQR